MKMIKKILYPVDLSETWCKIAPHVRLMAEKFDAEIHMIHVVHLTDSLASYEGTICSVQRYEHEIAKYADKKLHQMAETQFKDFSTTIRVTSGYPGEEILKYAEANDIDMIIMGHSRTGIERIVFGSVAAHVVKRAPMPTLIINPKIAASEEGESRDPLVESKSAG
jgi:nucleotide-binding universal stress UspA family protein